MSNTALSRKEKRALRLQICRTLDEHCGNCETKKQALKGKSGSAWDAANQSLQAYCNTQCPVGKQLHALASKLEGVQIRPGSIEVQPVLKVRPKPIKLMEVVSKPREELTPESYMQDREKGLRDWQIAIQYDITPSGLYSRKKRWREQGLLAGNEQRRKKA
ncbi:zinc-finger domain-containing protein [Aneurinibacillus thermoaerophilus]|uniref:Zinc-finger domain-containing protein n=1 Tax=Aneurinibacillus thermoaerophilus TaxID=143495 RepID=A0ABX8Y766_ANETH|nr:MULTISPECIES: zinc-finger domain-containing protein [Aneurinibacillus]AMA72751.1 hypothetical protein ACH33_07725 [Aneurinibacillus sp. XH2]MED0756889.1 zinc-finger domain-containing protein [Aneurinibacillus thermoaerophilus]MED0760939.1 zinc-finger domain-containing protein [Aneurinibacillus thermoaerophilus]QYY41490.1 zinc-finger domain-containing protein [Aneurinibacillus thermoaerophilus]